MNQSSTESTTPLRCILLSLGHARSAQAQRVRYERAIEAGFDGVEWSWPPVPHHDACAPDAAGDDLCPGSMKAKRAIAAVAARCLTTDVDRAVEEVITLLGEAARRHARCVNLAIPPVRRGAGASFARYQQAVNFALALMDRVRFEAEATGVAVALEAGGGGFLSPVELRDLIDTANSWAVGVCVDAGRIARIGLCEDWLCTLTHRVHSVRIPDPVAVRPAMEPTGAAVIDFTAIKTALGEIDYRRPIIVETAGDSVKLRPQVSQLGGRALPQSDS